LTVQPALAAEFEALYREQLPFVFRALIRFGVPTEVIEDAIQDVFVVVHRRFGAWSEHASVRAWLHGVVRRVAADQRRARFRHERRLAALPRTSDAVPLDEHVGDRRRLDALAEAIDRLEPSRREVYILTELEGMSAPEIAEALGCKLNTVYSRLRRARADLEALLMPIEGSHHGRAR
jgi:RNA polymerase sigma-70 factor (ECF subfamily)